MAMTIRADYVRPTCETVHVALPPASVDAIIELLDENDVSSMALRQKYYGSYAHDVAPETARAAIELAAPEFLPAVKDMLDFAAAHGCTVTLERPDPGYTQLCLSTGVNLNRTPVDEPEYNWCTSTAVCVFELLGFDISTEDRNSYGAADVMTALKANPGALHRDNEREMFALAEFALEKAGPQARILAY